MQTSDITAILELGDMLETHQQKAELIAALIEWRDGSKPVAQAPAAQVNVASEPLPKAAPKVKRERATPPKPSTTPDPSTESSDSDEEPDF